MSYNHGRHYRVVKKETEKAGQPDNWINPKERQELMMIIAAVLLVSLLKDIFLIWLAKRQR